MKKSKLKISPIFLIASLFVALAGFTVVLLTANLEETPYYQEQLNAAKLMAKAEEYLKSVVEEEGIPLEPEDLNQTGLIGPEWSELTTTLGHEDAKRTVLNPNTAALLVKYFKEAGLEEGSKVAIGSSGSFPGFAIATLCAATELKLDAYVIASYGSSMYGGTRVELTTIRIMQLLKEKGLVNFTLLAVSPGSQNDYGVGTLEGILYEGTRDVVVQMGEKEGVEFIDLNNLEKSIARRVELFGEDVECFVNVGGASTNSGASSYTLDFPEGLVSNPPRIPTTPNRGLVYEYAARGLPVINLLNVKKIVTDNGLPFDPIPLPVPGQGGVYFKTEYSPALIILTLLVSVSLLVSGCYWSRKKNAKKD